MAYCCALYWFSVSCFFLFTFTKKSKKGKFSGSNPNEIEVRALSAALQGSADPETLGKRIFSAIRFGNFMEYASLFPTQHESKMLMVEEKYSAYWSGPRSQTNLRSVFENLRENCFNGQATLDGIEVGNMQEIKIADQHAIPAASDCQLTLQSNHGESKNVPFGTIVKLPSGWKLFMPK